MASDPHKTVSGVEGLLSGLSGLLRTIGDLAEKGQELQKSGVVKDKDGRELGFHYGVSVRTLGQGNEVRVEPFGNLKQDRETGQTVVDEVREPIADVFEESDHVMVVLEMPGVGLEHVQLDVQGDVLTIAAERGTKRYRKELLLPHSFTREQITLTCNNGVFEVRCSKPS